MISDLRKMGRSNSGISKLALARSNQIVFDIFMHPMSAKLGHIIDWFPGEIPFNAPVPSTAGRDIYPWYSEAP